MTLPKSTRSWQRTKLVCTLGPATDSPDVLEELVRNGMDIARVNMSHGTHADHAVRIDRVRNVSRNLSKPISILADLPGPKFRIGALDGGSRKLEEGAIVYLTPDAAGPQSLPVRHRELLRALRADESVYLADGSIELRVKASGEEGAQCEVTAGGIVRSGSGINVPHSDLPALVPTDEDRAHIAFARSFEVDWLGVSFVQSADDLERVRACDGDGHMPLLMAKIEKRRALDNLDRIIEAADGVMVARGDLGVETDISEIPIVQKRIIAAASARGRPVVTATQMLESMVEHERPTRAEVTDVANAALDGTDAVMLSAESAIGRHPAAAVRILQRVLAATEAEYATRMAAASLQTAPSAGSDQAVAFAACQLAEQLDAKAIITHVTNYSMASTIARFRPKAPIVALSASQALINGLVMVRGVAPLHVEQSDSQSARMSRALGFLLACSLARSGDHAVVVASSGDVIGIQDTLQVVTLHT